MKENHKILLKHLNAALKKLNSVSKDLISFKTLTHAFVSVLM